MTIKRRLRRLGSIPPWFRRLRRNHWRRERCAECEHPFRWSRDARHSFGNEDGKVWHGPCISLVMLRGKAEERLRVLGVAVELTGINGSDVREAMNLRASTGQPGSGSDEWNVAWRVFHDLEKSTKAEEPA